MAPPAATASATRPRTRARARPATPGWRPGGGTVRRAILLIVLLAGLAAGYWLWLRDSSLVAVERVEVEGATTSAAEIRGVLEQAAREMTTLHVDREALEAAVREYPTVRSLSVDAHFPHGLTIAVEERMPVGVVDDSGEPVAVDGSGRLLPGVPLGGLPDLEAESPENARLEGAARAQAIVLGAAPRALLPAVEASAATDRGIEVRLTGGAELRFGDPVEAAAKWRAAAAVLADPDLTGLSYIDLRIPDRPAVGGDPRAAEPQPQL